MKSFTTSHPNLNRLLTRALPRSKQPNPAIETPPSLRVPPWTNSRRETTALADLKSRLGANAPNDETLRWFLRDRGLDVREANNKICATVRWRRKIGWNGLSYADVGPEKNLHKAWVHEGLDVLGRPVVVMVPARHISGRFPLENTQKICALVAEEALEKMPEGCETVLAVFDMRGFGPLNADLLLARFLVDLFFEYYPRRLGHVAVVEAPWVFQPVWEVRQALCGAS